METEKVTCPICEGEGRTGGHECPTCEGKGYIERIPGERRDDPFWQNMKELPKEPNF